MGLFEAFDLGDFVTLGVACMVLYLLLRSRHVTCPQPMAPETRTFLFELIKNNLGTAWSFLAMIVFLWALFYAMKLRVSEAAVATLTGLLTGAAGWMARGLQDKPARAPARSDDLIPGTEGTQETTVKTIQKTTATPPPPPVNPEPLVVQEIIEPVKIEKEDK